MRGLRLGHELRPVATVAPSGTTNGEKFDIEHDHADGIAGQEYGEVVLFLTRSATRA